MGSDGRVLTAGRPEPTTWWCEWAWLGGESATADVVVEVLDGRITAIEPGHRASPGATRLSGLTVPALANGHSHAFHRLLRARTHGGSGDFWTWRDTMYAVAQRLDPDSYHRLALGVFAEMAEAGIGVVGEFHYVHHQPDGNRYGGSHRGGANAMGEALVAAATEVGIRITLLDTLYLHGGLDASGHLPLRSEQRRFSDGSVEAWIERRRAWPGGDSRLVRRGAALHSIRAVDVARAAPFVERDEPLHVHVSEQPAENTACYAVHGVSPVRHLAKHGLLGPHTTMIHGTHVTDADILLMARTGAGCCFCPTTERELADGIGPSVALAEAGVPLCLGSDSHAVIDLLEEARALEMNQRLATLRRGCHQADDLLTMATANGYRSLGWGEGGRLKVGEVADFATIGLDSVRTVGTPPGPAVPFSASAADVTHLVVAGRTVVSDGRHCWVDAGAVLRRAHDEIYR